MASAAPNTGLPLLYNQLEPISSQQHGKMKVRGLQAMPAVANVHAVPLEHTDEEVRTLWDTAREAGVTFVDHADVYGQGLHRCERRWAEAVPLSPSERDAVTISAVSASAITTAPSTIQPVSPASQAASVPNVVNADWRPEPMIVSPSFVKDRDGALFLAAR